jgi:hypothetical protein
VRDRITAGAMKVLGPFPEKTVSLDPEIISEEDCGTYVRRKISIQVQASDRMPAYLLIPKDRPHPLPAVMRPSGLKAT